MIGRQIWWLDPHYLWRKICLGIFQQLRDSPNSFLACKIRVLYNIRRQDHKSLLETWNSHHPCLESDTKLKHMSASRIANWRPKVSQIPLFETIAVWNIESMKRVPSDL
jgi:hypothetical protein